MPYNDNYYALQAERNQQQQPDNVWAIQSVPPADVQPQMPVTAEQLQQRLLEEAMAQGQRTEQKPPPVTFSYQGQGLGGGQQQDQTPTSNYAGWGRYGGY